MMPPANSAFDLNLQPKMPPILMPAAEKAKVVMPMRAADKKNIYLQKGEGNSNCKSVDTGCYCHDQHGLKGKKNCLRPLPLPQRILLSC